MGTYYFLLNDTQKKSIHFDHNIKRGPITRNSIIHCAFVNYMFEHQGDSFRLVADDYDESYEYERLDLLGYKFEHIAAAEEITERLNVIYNRVRYRVVDGVIIDSESTELIRIGDGL